jgi:hypothetical protein
MPTFRILLTTVTLVASIACSAQNYDDVIELLRADLRMEKDAIVMGSLGLNQAETALFMPLYERYTVALKTHWEKRLALVDDYAKARDGLSDKQATSFMKRSTTLDLEYVKLRADHAKKVAKVLPATITGRWMALERRLGQLFELQIANEVPLLPMKN